MLYEISRHSISVTKKEETYMRWHNSILTVRTDKGIQLIEFSRNLQCLDANLDFLISFIPTPKSSPAQGLFPDEFLKNHLGNMDITQMFLDPGLWPHNKQLTEEMTNIADFKWSPAGVVYCTECVLAVLNNIGNVVLYGPRSRDWSCMLDLSAVIKERYSKDIVTNPTSLQEVKASVDAMESCAITFRMRLEDGSCYFTTAQRNGTILIWLLKCIDKNIVAELKAEISTNIGEIIMIQWIHIAHHSFWLTCSNAVGEIYILDCKIDNMNISIVNTSCLWTHKDRMVSQLMVHSAIGDNIVVIFNKHRHLVVVLLDKNCNKLSEVITNINDHRITDIIETDRDLYVSTINCKIYKINLKNTQTILDVTVNLMETKDQYLTNELYSINFSSNNVVCALATMDRKVMSRKIPEKIEIVFLSTGIHGNEINLLLDNPTQRLTGYWDCIELIRYKTVKLKALPNIDYNKLYEEGENNLYRLKLYFVLLMFYSNLEKTLKNDSRYWLPETSVETVRDKLRMSHATVLYVELCNIYNTNGTLDIFQLECFNGAKKYLNYCQKKKLIELVMPDVSIAEMEVDYVCQCCDEHIEGFTCKDGHLNMICSLTFTPIETDDYLVCKACGSIARVELLESKPLCLFCDIYLNNCHLPCLDD